ncbi:unnamed protein product [Urochloa humidicola]
MGGPASATARVARLAWAARHAARLASDAASRSAAAPRSRSLAAAASRAARSAAAAAWRAAREATDVADDIFEENRPHRQSSSLPARDPEPGVDVTAKDLESDEVVWALYENWCKAFNKDRSRDEMAHRFRVFKRCAEDVYEMNQPDDTDEEQMRLEEFSDGLDTQQIAQLKNETMGLIVAFHHKLIDEMRIDYPPSNQSP